MEHGQLLNYVGGLLLAIAAIACFGAACYLQQRVNWLEAECDRLQRCNDRLDAVLAHRNGHTPILPPAAPPSITAACHSGRTRSFGCAAPSPN